MLTTGTTVDNRFEILSLLGHGAFGDVYMARQVQLDRTVAVKLLKKGIADEDSILRFDREAKILSQLQHPNIAMFVAFGEWGDYRYTALEFVKGKPLSTYLQLHGALTASRTVLIAHKLLEALAHAHKQGVVHRDIKPHNIIVSDDLSTIKLIDFGLAHIFAKQRLTQEGLAVGSVQYMSPEQCSGLPVDERSDLYSVGCILYECLVGEPAFIADDAVAIMYMQMNESRKVFGKGNEALAMFVNRLLEKQPEKRFATADEALAQLDKIQVVDSLQITGRHEAAKVTPQRKPPTKKIAAFAAVFAALAGVAYFALHQKPEVTSFDFNPRLNYDTPSQALRPLVEQRIKLIDEALPKLKDANDTNRPVLQAQIEHELSDIWDHCREKDGMQDVAIVCIRKELLLPWPDKDLRYAAARYVGMISVKDPAFYTCDAESIQLFTERNEERDADVLLAQIALMIQNRLWAGKPDEAHKYAQDLIKFVHQIADYSGRRGRDEISMLNDTAKVLQRYGMSSDAEKLHALAEEIHQTLVKDRTSL